MTLSYANKRNYQQNSALESKIWYELLWLKTAIQKIQKPSQQVASNMAKTASRPWQKYHI